MRPKFFYGYVIIALCFINMVVMRGVNGAFGVYSFASPLVGLAVDRRGPRLLMPLGALLVGGGLVLSSFAGSLVGLYFSYGIITALGQGALGFVGPNSVVSF